MTQQELRVGIDLTAIWRQPTGIFRYAMELARHLLLAREQEDAAPIHYVFVFAQQIHPDFLPLRDTFETVICPTTNELFIKQCWFPLVLPRLNLDVIHYPAFPPPYVQPFVPRTVMTLHDAGPWRYPQALTLHGRLYFRTLLARGLRTSTRVITVSNHARAEIAHFLGEHFLPKISVIPEAAHPHFARPCSDLLKASVRNDYRLPERYLLAVATVEPRKNLVALLDAYILLRTQLGNCCPPLVIVGRKGWQCGDILNYMAELGDKVLFPGHVTDEQLVALYQMATCLVFPSLYEGFGLPILEAMMAGCPVITSKTSSLPEVAGAAALLVDPLKVQEIASAMHRVLNDDDLRDRMIRQGYAQAALFSWAQTASLTSNLYRLAAKG